MPSNDSESLQSLLQKIHNRRVREKFRDDIDIEGNTPESALKREVTIKDNDTHAIMTNRVLLFNYYCSEGLDNILNEVYGIPREETFRTFNVKIQFHFQEKPPYDSGKTPKRLYVTLPTQERVNTITETKINSFKNKIERTYQDNFFHYCGFNKYDYYDSFNSLNISVPGRTLNEAREFLSRLLAIINLNYEEAYVKEKVDVNRVAKNSKTIRVLGQTRRILKNIKTGNVTLKKAVLIVGNYETRYLYAK